MYLLVQPEYPPTVGGMQSHATALADGLYRRGHQIVVVTYAQCADPRAARDYDTSRPYPTLRILSRLGFWANVSRLTALAAELQPVAIYSSTTFYGLLAETTGLPVVCRSVGNDVMRCWIPYPFRFGSGLLGSPRVERQLERLYTRMRSPAWLEDVMFGARARLVQRASLAATTILANSSYTVNRLLEAGVEPDRAVIVAGGVDSRRFGHAAEPDLRAKLGLQARRPVVLTVCRLVLKKGVDVLLRAVAQAALDLPEIALLVVGDGPERDKCEAVARELGIAERVVFAGRVPHAQVADYYHAADFFVMASRVHQRKNGWSDVETMGRVACEANAAGLPVIASDTGGVRSVVQDDLNGLLVPPDDPEVLAGALTRLAGDQPLRERLAREGLLRAQREFDWEIVVSQFEQALDLAAHGHLREAGIEMASELALRSEV